MLKEADEHRQFKAKLLPKTTKILQTLLSVVFITALRWTFLLSVNVYLLKYAIMQRCLFVFD